MARRLAWCTSLALTACVSHQTRFFAADVQSAGSPLDGALVLLACEGARYAQRTDARGQARVKLVAARALSACSVLAAMPGYATAEIPEVQLHTDLRSPPIAIELAPLADPPASEVLR